MYVSDNETTKGVAKFKDLTTIATNSKPVWNGNINVARERLSNESKRWKKLSIIKEKTLD